MKKILLIAIAVLSLSSCMIKTEKKARNITVTGTGSIAVENKEATLALSVITRNEDVIKASEENAEKMTAVMKAITEAGVSSDSMNTSDYSIRQEEVDRQFSKKASIQYVVSNRLHINIKDIARTGVIIDAAIKAGANQMDSLSYTTGDTKEAEKQARILAIRDADQKANILVATSGLTLGQVVNIAEREDGYYPVRPTALLKGNGFNTPISAGTTLVQVAIDVTYELQ
ncbi:SIMPL domain-containing protein [Treponema sp.]|uniref:SIMPL domain-containing protein n=1 Tax=Treponema sp. TaxID=166 RepID=UPI00388D9779